MDSKKPWESKTNWAALIIAVAAFFPPAAQFIAENPQVCSMVVGALMVGLRLITKKQVLLKAPGKIEAP